MTPLSMNNNGSKVKIIKIHGKKNILNRLNILGIAEGKEIEIIKNNFGHLIIKIENSRIVLGRGLSNKIIVQ